ncbi:MAG: tryptophan synthase subunit alpha [Vampirovibrionales bacterium]|nr:tryptophan synthase subunit alpha [Vampirovibrionales bacterium]
MNQTSNKTLLMPFTVLGWPNVATSAQIIDTLASNGADALELGLPFSEPIADGPVIQAAVTEALENGFTMADGWALIAQTRAKYPDLPISLLVYTNTVLSVKASQQGGQSTLAQCDGPEAFYSQAKACGVNAVLVADSPVEASMETLIPEARKHGIAPVFIVSPLTDESRIQAMAEAISTTGDAALSPSDEGSGASPHNASKAFKYWYVVSRLGITGTEARYDTALNETLAKLKRLSNLPALVGFGISMPEHVAQMRDAGANGVIIGSKIIQMIQAASAAGRDWQAELTDWMHAMRKACQAIPANV